MEDINSLFEKEAAQAASFSINATVSALAARLIDLEREKEATEERLKELNEKIHTIRSRDLPDVMGQLGQSEFTLKIGRSEYDGAKVKVADIVHGSLPKEDAKRKAAVAELEKLGGSGLIQTTVSTFIPKTKHNHVVMVEDAIRNLGFTPDTNATVHHSTLQAFGRELLRTGAQFDPEVLGLFVGRFADVKLPRK